MKLFIRIILLAAIDFIIIWLWVKQINPDPSVSIGIILLVPFVVLLNLLIALVFYLFKKPFVILFLVNAVISGILMNYLFGKGVERYQANRLETWQFKVRDTVFELIHWKEDGTFSMSESTNQGTSTDFLNGKFVKDGSGYHFKTDCTEYIIKNNYIYKFRKPTDSIKLLEQER